MNNRIEIIMLVSEKNTLEKSLKALNYGSAEIREKDGKKYVYVHYREDGISITKYLGEYSDELYNMIINNNIKAKELKIRIRNLNKTLKSLGYVESHLDEKVELNIDFARRHMVDMIYKQAVLEGIATTYSDTETIIECGKVSNMTASDIMKVVNLKRAWEFILNKDVISAPANFALLCEINKFIEDGFYYNAGRVRSTPVSIGGINWQPPLPIESAVKEELEEKLSSSQTAVDKAIDLMLYIMKRQIFIDGNKRTAVIFANHILISHAQGLIAVPNQKVDDYKKLLVSYYEGKNETEIKNFLKEICYIKLE